MSEAARLDLPYIRVVVEGDDRLTGGLPGRRVDPLPVWRGARRERYTNLVRGGCDEH